MKRIIAICLMLTGCGYSSIDNEMIGQVKKVNNNSPLVCPDFLDTDISLGVIRNGVGSMSSEDVWLYAPNASIYQKLKQANETGQLVKIKYNVKRFSWCVEHHQITDVQIVKNDEQSKE